jgi:hypothetical protein
MMSKEESDVVKTVYARFIESEGDSWTGIDDNIEFFGYLSDSELIKEAEIKCSTHYGKVLRCTQDHEQQNCFAPFILEAVEAILNLYEKTGELHKKNQYIITYYLALSEMRMIFPY